jgi:hypothetical protein
MEMIPWPNHAPVAVSDVAFRPVVLGVLKPGRRLTAEGLARAARAIVGPENQALTHIDLIQLALDLLMSVEKIRVDTYGKRQPDLHISSVAGDSNIHPAIRAQILCSAIVQEVTCRLPGSPKVLTIIERLNESLKDLTSGYGWFWSHIALMTRMYQVRMNWLGFIRTNFTTNTKRLFEHKGLMPVDKTWVDGFAANLMAVRTHGLQTSYFDQGILVPEHRVWVYLDGLAVRSLLSEIQAPDLLNHVALCFLASSDNVADLSISVVKEGGQEVGGLKFSFLTELQFAIRMDGTLDIGEIASCPLEELFEQMGCGWAYQPFRFVQLLRLHSMIVVEDAADPAVATGLASGSRKGRHGKRAQPLTRPAQGVPDFWLPRVRRLQPDTVFAQLADARKGVHGYGRHWVPGYFRPRQAGTKVSPATVALALKEQLRKPGSTETYCRGHWHCQERDDEIKSHRARQHSDAP